MRTLARRPAWALAALVVTACGGSGPSRLDMHTPGTQTGHASSAFPFVIPSPAATPTPAPTPKPEGGPVTREEKRIIRGWSDELRAGHVAAASRYFELPALVSASYGLADTLVTRADVQAFNSGFPCGAKLVRTRRAAKHFVIGTFRLTERPGAKCDGPGHLAEVAFLIKRHHIAQWVRTPDPQPKPTPTPKPVGPDRA